MLVLSNVALMRASARKLSVVSLAILARPGWPPSSWNSGSSACAAQVTPANASARNAVAIFMTCAPSEPGLQRQVITLLLAHEDVAEVDISGRQREVIVPEIRRENVPGVFLEIGRASCRERV